MIPVPNRAASGTTWCGPYALATISGLTYEEAYQKALKVTKKTIIKGLGNFEFRQVAYKLGFNKFNWVFLGKP